MIEKTGNDLVVIASNPAELAENQHATIEQVGEKLRGAEIELRQASVMYESAMNHGISTKVAARLVNKAGGRVDFLTKVKSALEAGYLIVPNFPGETIAVRVKRSKPRHQTAGSEWNAGSADRSIVAEKPDVLPEGHGNYVNPSQLVRRNTYTEKKPDGREVKMFQSTAIAFQNEIGLPVDFMKPTVIERTGKCMARKIFDEIAISDNQFSNAGGIRRGDPMVIGRLIDRSRNNRVLSFLVAWFVDTSAI